MSLDSLNLIDYFRNQAGNNERNSGNSSLDSLMNFHDELFVDAAFRALLRRPADPVGLSYYTGRLRRGFSRVSVLDQLVRSTEIRSDWRDISGLDIAISRYRRSRKPGGWRLALSDPELGITSSLRGARMLQNSLGAQRQMLVQAVEKMEAGDHSQLEGLGALHTLTLAPAVSGKNANASFEPPQPRRIDNVRSVDLSDHIRQIVGKLPL